MKEVGGYVVVVVGGGVSEGLRLSVKIMKFKLSEMTCLVISESYILEVLSFYANI